MALVVALKLAKSGWWGGDPGKVMQAPADEVMAAAQYSNFVVDYENATFQLNKEKA